MNLDGTIHTKCPPAEVALLLLSPQALRNIVPMGCEVGERAGDSVPFVLRRKVGPINLNMAGNLNLTPRGQGYTLVMQASHMVAGRIKITLNLDPQSAGQENSLSWTGKLESQGLASRLLQERAGRVRMVVKNMFQNLRAQAEAA